MPLDAQYVSMRMKGKDISVRSANDVLVWVCKKMSVYQPKQLQSMMKRRKVSWIKVNRIGMNRPYRVTFNCYVDLDGVGPTSLLRAATILKWLSWPKNDVTISYKLPPKTIIDVGINHFLSSKNLAVSVSFAKFIIIFTDFSTHVEVKIKIKENIWCLYILVLKSLEWNNS